jgi:ribosomal protein S18 acetylase RimI-like enzyme
LRTLPLGLRTDLLTGSRGLVTRRHGDALVLRTTDFDAFYFGNKLLLPAPPRPAEVPERVDQWRAAFADAPGVEKIVLQWETAYDDPATHPGLEQAGAAFGLELDRDVLLRLGTFKPVAPRTPMRARCASSDADWQAVLDVALDNEERPGRRAFHAWRRAEHRNLAEAGRGLWWLAEADRQVVASAGIFWDETGTLARFQDVDTVERARNRGFASGLLSAMLTDLPQRLPGLETCVIVTAGGSQAERIYRRLGFEPMSRLEALWGDR